MLHFSETISKQEEIPEVVQLDKIKNVRRVECCKDHQEFEEPKDFIKELSDDKRSERIGNASEKESTEFGRYLRF